MILLATTRIHYPGFFQKQIRDVGITIIYDNYTDFENLQGDWGFSCLIEGKDKNILFDTGTNPEIFRENLDKLNVDLQSIDLVVISHNHGDHTGGLPVLIEKGVNIPVYIPVSVQNDFSRKFPETRSTVVSVSTPIEICNGVFLTGEMGDQIREQSLVVETSRGWVIITGCAHPGILQILDQAVEITEGPIFLVMGGFHMLDQDQADIEKVIAGFKNHQVIHCAPTHCTGEDAIRLFQEAYRENFLRLGSGKKISISGQGGL
jgi:7,8-dihydropterin-6-yl-methyl-4-(beta-D-ribofuranosyl)aminobenzene 5'-phosphate synthase